MGDERAQWDELLAIRRDLVAAAVRGSAPPRTIFSDLEEWIEDLRRLPALTLSAESLAQIWGNLQLIMIECGPESAQGLPPDGDLRTAWRRVRRAAEDGFSALLNRSEWASLRAEFTEEVLPHLADAVGQERHGRMLRCIDAVTHLRMLAQRTSGIPHTWILRRVTEMQYPLLTADGWRARMGEDFSTRRADAVIRAMLNAIAQWGWRDRPLVVGYDSRLGANGLAAQVTEIAVSLGQPVHLCQRDAPTPALLSYLHETLGVDGAAGALICTAAQLPVKEFGSTRYFGRSYQGISLFLPTGSQPSPEQLVSMSRHAAELLLEPAAVEMPSQNGRVTIFNPMDAYCRQSIDAMGYTVVTPDGDEELARDVFTAFWGQSQAMVVIDEMYSAVRGYLPTIFDRLGIRYEVLHGEKDPSFGDLGAANPRPPFTGDLIVRMRELRDQYSPLIGLAFDTDGQRVGVVDETGSYLPSGALVTMLADFLLRDAYPGMPGVMARSRITPKVFDRLANSTEFTERIVAPGKQRMPDSVQPVFGKSRPSGNVTVLDATAMPRPEEILLAVDADGGVRLPGAISKDGLRAALVLLQYCALHGSDVQALWRQLQWRIGASHTETLELQAPDLTRYALINGYLESYARTDAIVTPAMGQSTVQYVGGTHDRFVEWALLDGNGNPAYLSITLCEPQLTIRIDAEAYTEELAHQLLLIPAERLAKLIDEQLHRAGSVWQVVDILASVTSPLAVATEFPGTLNCHMAGEAYSRLQELARPGREAGELMRLAIGQLNDSYPDKGRALAVCHFGEQTPPVKAPPIPRVLWESDGEESG